MTSLYAVESTEEDERGGDEEEGEGGGGEGEEGFGEMPQVVSFDVQGVSSHRREGEEEGDGDGRSRSNSEGSSLYGTMS